MAKILKFSTPHCGQCTALEARLNKERIDHENIDCTSDEGAAMADKFVIRNVPVVIVLNDDESVRVRYNNLGEAIANIDTLRQISKS